MTLATSRRELERWLATAAFTRTTDSDCASSAKANARSTCRFATSSSARGAPSAGRFSWRPRTWRSGSPSSPAAAPRRRGSPWCSLPLEADDRRVQRLGRTHRIEVLAKKRDLPGPGTKEHDILLAVHTSGPLDETFRLHFGDSGCWVGEGMHSHVRKAELLIERTGRVYRQEYVVFLRARAGKITFLREYFDPVRAAKALDASIVGLQG